MFTFCTSWIFQQYFLVLLALFVILSPLSPNSASALFWDLVPNSPASNTILQSNFLVNCFCYWGKESLVFRWMYYLGKFLLKNKWKWKRQTSWEKSSRDGSKKGSFISVWNVMNALNNPNLPCILNILISSKKKIPLNIICWENQWNVEYTYFMELMWNRYMAHI